MRRLGLAFRYKCNSSLWNSRRSSNPELCPHLYQICLWRQGYCLRPQNYRVLQHSDLKGTAIGVGWRINLGMRGASVDSSL